MWRVAGIGVRAEYSWYGQAELAICRYRLEEGCGCKGRSWVQVGVPWFRRTRE